MGRRTISNAVIAVIVLAAGESRRWGDDNKLLAPVGSMPMIRRTVEMALASGLRPVTVVTGHEADAVVMALDCLPIKLAHAPNFAEGMSASLKAGVSASAASGGVLICLGDMPWVKPETLAAIAAAHDPAEDRIAIIPTYRGERGNPVLLTAAIFDEVARLSGDQGARKLFAAAPDRVTALPVDDPGVLRDADNPEALAGGGGR
jgi:molybdenum cofactor cytidylyltransferase